MSDLISRKVLLDKMISRKSLFSTNQYEYMALSEVDKARADEIDNCIADLRNAPDAESERTANVECIAEVYRGEIVDHYLSGVCEICGESTYDHAKYCSECGAKLKWSK